MGRGRKKARATKIARELKYADPGTDLFRLQAELRATSSTLDVPGPLASETSDPDGE